MFLKERERKLKRQMQMQIFLRKYFTQNVSSSEKLRKILQQNRNARFYQISAWTALQKLLNNVPEGKGNGNSKTGTTVVF